MTTRAMFTVLVCILGGCASAQAPAGSPNTSAPASAAAPTEQVPDDCVNPPLDVTTLIEQAEPAACYGSADLTFEAHARLVQGVVDCGPEVEPAWLHCGGQMVELYALDGANRPLHDVVLAARSPDLGPSLWAVVHPASGIDLHRGLDAAVTVTGHFDDPDARTCRYAGEVNPEAASPPEEVIQNCRSRFVITDLELLDQSEDTDGDDDSGAAGAFSPHDIAQVIDTDLVVRSAPGVAADSEIFDWQLDPPTLLYVFDGPVAADGYEWYQVMPAGVDYLPSPYHVGWVAAGSREGDPWIASPMLDCPEPTTEELAALSGLAALACFGDADLRLEGELGGCVARNEPSATEPWPTRCWLSPFDCCPDVMPYPSGLVLWFEAVLSSPLAEPQPRLVTGHFDDPSASACADTPFERTDWSGLVPVGWGQFVCRTSFVVSDVTPLDD